MLSVLLGLCVIPLYIMCYMMVITLKAIKLTIVVPLRLLWNTLFAGLVLFGPDIRRY